MRAIWVPHSDIPVGQQVAVDATPDAVAHELLDVLDHRRALARRPTAPSNAPQDD